MGRRSRDGAVIRPDQAGVAPNPHYGAGVFRRRIRLDQIGQTVRVALEDCSHAMQLELHLDGQRIRQVSGKVLRAPVTTCQQAPEKLQAFIGLPLYHNIDDYRRDTPQNIHCTHLYDMALLAIEHSQAAYNSRQIDVVVGDERDGIICADIRIDGQLIHQWTLRGGCIESPAKYAGQSAFKGFIAWAKANFEGDELRCALALQRGLMVANARRWDMASVAGQPANTFGPGPGVCYSYSEGRDRHGLRSQTPTRDFTHCPQQLLKFQ